MPLRAISDVGDIQAFELDTQKWADLKGDYKRLNLRIPCCGVAAIPKTSTLGYFFFAHARKGDCTTAPESAEHIYCKNLIAKAAQNAGWKVTTERPGISPAGEEWIADVFCERGTAKLALEVQMSPQSLEETVRRQERYKCSGVRAAWLLGPKVKMVASGSNEDLPAFDLGPVVVGTEPKVVLFKVDLSAFITGMLNRQLKWTEPMVTRPLLVEYLDDVCWNCSKSVKQVYGLQRRPGDGYQWHFHERHFTVATISSGIEAVMKDVDNSELIEAGLNPLIERKVIKNKPTRWGFSNLCLHCRAPQDNFHLSKKLHAAINCANYISGSSEDSYLGDIDDEEVEDEDERKPNPLVLLMPFDRTFVDVPQWVYVV